jgi:hypothetical protein
MASWGLDDRGGLSSGVTYGHVGFLVTNPGPARASASSKKTFARVGNISNVLGPHTKTRAMPFITYMVGGGLAPIFIPMIVAVTIICLSGIMENHEHEGKFFNDRLRLR